MSKTDYAFPRTSKNGVSSNGMTLRDYFAAIALQGLMINPGIKYTLKNGLKDIQEQAYYLADKMLEERKKYE